LRALDHGRRVIERALGGRPHFAMAQADFEIAMALRMAGRAKRASQHCTRMVAVSRKIQWLELETQDRIRRAIACGHLDARGGRAASARAAFMEAMAASEAAGDESLQFELLVRLAALARLEERDSAETKLFERALALLSEERISTLPELLEDAYANQGVAQPSSAAARLAHTAARRLEHRESAARLQEIAKTLGDAASSPASRE
jgi:hypothetical protein